MTFPLLFVHEGLQPRDFVRHELLFLRTVLDFLPCESVHFIPVLPENGEVLPASGSEDEYPEMWMTGVSLVRKQMQPVVDSEGQILFLPVWNTTKLAAVAVISGGSRKLYGQYASEWLLERSRLISREFHSTKQWAQEPASGLLNALHLREELDVMTRMEYGFAAESKETVCSYLFLVEIAVRSKNAGQSLRGIAAIGAYLDSLAGEFASVHHLGAGVFGFIWHAAGLAESRKVGYAILRKLQRRSCVKVHIGIAPLRAAAQSPAGAVTEGAAAEAVLALAWEAVSSARLCGHFALCSAQGVQSEEHPLRLAPEKVLHDFMKLWRRQNLFSIALFEKDIVSRTHFSARVKVLTGEGNTFIPVDARYAYVFLPGMDAGAAKQWAGELQEKIREIGIGTFSVGIASYPCPGFKKNETPLNAKKALLHGNFYGPDTVTAFDGVSLNISGDIYYNDGDLLGAVREYRLGLNLDPDNINLLNSLGVIYAQLDKYAMAIPLFEKALTLNAKDFMALFNLGHAHLRRNSLELAVAYFEKAYAENDTYFDLLLQLGQIYCNNGQYKKAVTLLSKAEKGVASSAQPAEGSPWEHCEPWHDVDDSLGHGMVYRYLGEAYKGCGNARQAMTYLQRATRYNSRDAAALSLLGELYLSEKQGADIALALCRQAVELDENVGMHWYRLATVLLARKERENALHSVQQCLRLEPGNIACLMLLAALYEKSKKYVLARKTYERVLRLDGTNKRAVKALTRMNK